MSCKFNMRLGMILAITMLAASVVIAESQIITDSFKSNKTTVNKFQINVDTAGLIKDLNTPQKTTETKQTEDKTVSQEPPKSMEEAVARAQANGFVPGAKPPDREGYAWVSSSVSFGSPSEGNYQILKGWQEVKLMTDEEKAAVQKPLPPTKLVPYDPNYGILETVEHVFDPETGAFIGEKLNYRNGEYAYRQNDYLRGLYGDIYDIMANGKGSTTDPNDAIREKEALENPEKKEDDELSNEDLLKNMQAKDENVVGYEKIYNYSEDSDKGAWIGSKITYSDGTVEYKQTDWCSDRYGDVDEMMKKGDAGTQKPK